MNMIWGPLPPTTDPIDTGPPRRPVSREAGGVPPAAGLASSPDQQPEVAAGNLPSWLVWMTCVHDGADHAVTDTELATGPHHDNGIYQAVCGRTVTPHAMVTPSGRPCTTCCATLSQLRPPTRPRLRRLRWLARLRTVLKRR